MQYRGQCDCRRPPPSRKHCPVTLPGVGVEEEEPRATTGPGPGLGLRSLCVPPVRVGAGGAKASYHPVSDRGQHAWCSG